MNIAPRQRQAGTGRKAGGGSAVPPQDDLGRERVIREACDRSDLFSGKAAQGIAQAKMVSRDMNRQVGHDSWVLLGLRERCGVAGGRKIEAT